MAMKKKTTMKKSMCKGTCSPKKGMGSSKAAQIDKAYTKSQIAAYVACCAELSKAQAASAVEALAELIKMHLKKRGPGEFTLPGLAKFRIIHKAATKARQGKNPFTGETMTFPAKPARNVVKIRPLKNLKEIVA